MVVSINLAELLRLAEDTLMAQFREAGGVPHRGDRGENREQVFREFLARHLPQRYGVAKGQILTAEGEHSFAADVIIYDALNCPVLYAGQTQLLPIEGIFGVIEVKSTLSKHELDSALGKIAAFKKMPLPDRAEIRQPTISQGFMPSRPFGVVFGYQLAENSLPSLAGNWRDHCKETPFVDHWANLIVIMNAGLIQIQEISGENLSPIPLLDTLQLMRMHLLKSPASDKLKPKFQITPIDLHDRTFGRFFVYLLIMLEQMHLGIPDLSRYLGLALRSQKH